MAPLLVDFESPVVEIWSSVLIGTLAAICFVSLIVVCACCQGEENQKSLAPTVGNGRTLSDAQKNKTTLDMKTNPMLPKSDENAGKEKKKRKCGRKRRSTTSTVKTAGAEKENLKLVETKGAASEKKLNPAAEPGDAAASLPHYYDPSFKSAKSPKAPVIRPKPTGTVDRRSPHYKTMFGTDDSFDPTNKGTECTETVESSIPSPKAAPTSPLSPSPYVAPTNPSSPSPSPSPNVAPACPSSPIPATQGAPKKFTAVCTLRLEPITVQEANRKPPQDEQIRKTTPVVNVWKRSHLVGASC